MERMDRRAIGRVPFPARGVVVVCDTKEVLPVHVRDLGPIGVGVKVDTTFPNLVGKDVILVAETLIMYANVARQSCSEDGDCVLGLSAKKFTEEVLQYMFDRLQLPSESRGADR